jgi:hypothetical protein
MAQVVGDDLAHRKMILNEQNFHAPSPCASASRQH